MAISEHQEQSPSLLDALYCAEEQWEEDEQEEHELNSNIDSRNPSLLPLLLLEQDLFWEDEELINLFSKEKKQESFEQTTFYFSLSSIRREKVEWMLMVNAHYGFCTLTSVLAVNYFDRFISSFPLQNDKPWMFQLAAVTCVSLAAKVEETHVPLLLDLQVEGTKYAFEAKTIQKMELLVLSTLEWRMNPVTPISFLDHIIRRLGLKSNLHWEFLRRCERLLLSVLPDWRFVSFVPSVLAAATMMHVIDQIEPCNPLDYQNQLLAVLNITKEKVNECYKLMEGLSSSRSIMNPMISSKRKFDQMMHNVNINHAISDDINAIPSSPSGVIDASYYLSSGDSSNDSWAATTTTSHIITASSSLSSLTSPSLSSSSSVSSSPVISSSSSGGGSRKKGRVQVQLPSLSRVFVVDAVGSPRR